MRSHTFVTLAALGLALALSNPADAKRSGSHHGGHSGRASGPVAHGAGGAPFVGAYVGPGFGGGPWGGWDYARPPILYGVAPWAALGGVVVERPAVFVGDPRVQRAASGMHLGMGMNAGPGFAPSEVIAVYGTDASPLWPVGVRPRDRNGKLR